MKSISFNHDQSTSSGSAATGYPVSTNNLKGLFSQTNGMVAHGKRNSNLRQNLEGMSNTTNGISSKDQNYHRTNLITDKYVPGSEYTPKVAQGGAYTGILEARGAINGSQMSIFSNDMILARANQKQNGSANVINSKGGNESVHQNTSIDPNDPKKDPNVTGNKKSSIDVTAIMEKIQSYKVNANTSPAVHNNPTTGDNFQIQARIKSFNYRVKSDQDELALMHHTDESFRKANQVTNLITKLPGVRVSSTNQSSRVTSGAQSNNF